MISIDDYMAWDACEMAARVRGGEVTPQELRDAYAIATNTLSDPERQRLSDYTCTALQLTNFWQDVARG